MTGATVFGGPGRKHQRIFLFILKFNFGCNGMVNCTGRDNVGGAFNGNLRDCNDISLVKKFPSLGSFQLICLLMKGIEYQVLQGVKEAHNSQA